MRHRQGLYMHRGMFPLTTPLLVVCRNCSINLWQTVVLYRSVDMSPAKSRMVLLYMFFLAAQRNQQICTTHLRYRGCVLLTVVHTLLFPTSRSLSSQRSVSKQRCSRVPRLFHPCRVEKQHRELSSCIITDTIHLKIFADRQLR